MITLLQQLCDVFCRISSERFFRENLSISRNISSRLQETLFLLIRHSTLTRFLYTVPFPSERVTQDEAKDVYLSLRQAAGVFKLIRDKYAPNLQSQPKQDRDLHTDILEAYINQSLAEAQEGTFHLDILIWCKGGGKIKTERKRKAKDVFFV